MMRTWLISRGGGTARCGRNSGADGYTLLSQFRLPSSEMRCGRFSGPSTSSASPLSNLDFCCAEGGGGTLMKSNAIYYARRLAATSSSQKKELQVASANTGSLVADSATKATSETASLSSVGKRISRAKQREIFPGLRKETKKFEGQHTFSYAKNTAAMVSDSASLVVMPVMFLSAYVLQWFVVLPFLETWTFFWGYTALVAACARLAARGRTNRIVKDLSGKTVLITGATHGIGLETAVQLASMGANVHVVSRNGAHVEAAMERIRGAAARRSTQAEGETQKITFTPVDFADLVATRDFARRLRAAQEPIDILINNAAILRDRPSMTRFHEDEMLVVNLLAPYLLTEGLLPLVEDAGGRIVNVSSNAHVAISSGAVNKYLAGRGFWAEKRVGRSFDGLEHYGFTKLGLIFYTQQLAIRSYPPAAEPTTRQGQAAIATGARAAPSVLDSAPNFTVCSLHPGGVLTNIYSSVSMGTWLSTLKYLLMLVMKTQHEGSQTVVNCALRDDIVNGGYYMNCRYRPEALSLTACDTKERTAILDWVTKKMAPYNKLD